MSDPNNLFDRLNISEGSDWNEEWIQKSLSPDQRLIAALLRRAIMDIVNTACDISAADKQAAKRWMFSSLNKTPFSFLWCCEALELAPDVFRGQVQLLLSPSSRKSRRA